MSGHLLPYNCLTHDESVSFSRLDSDDHLSYGLPQHDRHPPKELKLHRYHSQIFFLVDVLVLSAWTGVGGTHMKSMEALLF